MLQLGGVLKRPDKRFDVWHRDREVDQAQTANSNLRVLMIEAINQVLEVILRLDLLQDELVAVLVHYFEKLDNEFEPVKVL